MGPLGGKDAIPRVTKACRTPRDSHILPIVVPTLPRPTMVTVSAPEDDASARHLAGDILDALRPRHDRPTATRAGEPAADIGRARACGPRKSRKGAHPSSCHTAGRLAARGRRIAPLAKKMRPEPRNFSPSPNPGSAPVTPARPRVIAPSLRVESRSSTSTGRGSAWFDPSAGGRTHGSLDSVSGREKQDLSRTHGRGLRRNFVNCRRGIGARGFAGASRLIAARVRARCDLVLNRRSWRSA